MLLFMSLITTGGVFVYESFRDQNKPAMIGISISMVVLVCCVFIPSFIHCKCEKVENDSNQSEHSDFLLQNIV